MNRKVYYSIVGTIMLLMAGYFALNMLSLPKTECYPHLNGTCMYAMELDCASIGEDHSGFWVLMGYCDHGDCIGFWVYYCGIPPIYRGVLDCCDTGSWQCDFN